MSETGIGSRLREFIMNTCEASSRNPAAAHAEVPKDRFFPFSSFL